MEPEVRAIRPSELEECLALWDTIWPEDGRAYFARYFFGDHDFQPEYTRVCVADGRIVSAAHIVKRVVSCGEFTLTMGGIANVVTLPEYRRKGYSRACLRQCIEVMEADAMDFSLLFTGTHPLYEGLGWERVPMETLVGSIRPAAPPETAGITVRPYRAEDDEAIHRIYAEFNRTRPVTVKRTGPYWREWIGMHGGRGPGHAIVAADGGQAAGYAIYLLGNAAERSRVLEIGAAEDREDVIEPLLAKVCMDSASAGAKEVELPLGDERAIRLAAERLFDRVESDPEDSAMVRFLHRDNLLRGLAPELTMRWLKTGGPDGSLAFATPYGPTQIRSANGFLRVEEADTQPGALGQADLFQLLIGRGATTVPADHVPFAAALFPAQAAWYWETDGF